MTTKLRAQLTLPKMVLLSLSSPSSPPGHHFKPLQSPPSITIITPSLEHHIFMLNYLIWIQFIITNYAWTTLSHTHTDTHIQCLRARPAIYWPWYERRFILCSLVCDHITPYLLRFFPQTAGLTTNSNWFSVWLYPRMDKLTTQLLYIWKHAFTFPRSSCYTHTLTVTLPHSYTITIPALNCTKNPRKSKGYSIQTLFISLIDLIDHGPPYYRNRLYIYRGWNGQLCL